MATKKLKSFKGRALRITRLDLCGNPVYGPASSIVAYCFVTVTIGEEVESGTEYSSKNAWGEYCVNEVDDDIIKWANVTIEMAEIDPDVMDIIGGATPVVVDDVTIGWTRGPNQTSGAFAIEVWTGIAGADACSDEGLPDWGYVVVPFVKNGKLDGDLTIAAATLNVSLAGKGFTNRSWGQGPYNDRPWLDPTGFPVGETYGAIVTDVQPPAPTDGAVPLNDIANVEPGDVFAAEPTVTAQDGTNAAKLTPLGYVPDVATAWLTGEFFTVGTFKFNWTGAAWAAGIHA